jgi:hypothetical protein
MLSLQMNLFGIQTFHNIVLLAHYIHGSLFLQVLDSNSGNAQQILALHYLQQMDIH